MCNSSYRQVALVTGANKGIGFEIARQLGKDHGMTILLGARDEDRGQAAAEKLKGLGIDARAVRLDVTDRASVEAVARHIERDFGGRLDVLVNNAGIALDRNPPSQTDLDKFKATHETNVFGPLLVTTTMLPLLKRSPAGRVVNMSSGLGSLAQNNDPTWEFAQVRLVAYNSSKAALNMQTVLFARELAAESSTIKGTQPIPVTRPPILIITRVTGPWRKARGRLSALRRSRLRVRPGYSSARTGKCPGKYP